jgi:phage FluMu protein Com
MQQYRCKNIECRRPVLFEGEFTGTIKKICPKCKEMNIFYENDIVKDKFCKE